MSRIKKYDFIVYKTTDIKTGLIYIGYDSKNNPKYYGSGYYFNRVVNSRIKDYIINTLYDMYDETKKNEYRKKYISLLFTKEILNSYNTIDDMLMGEIYHIKKFNSQNKDIGYNITPGGKWGDTFTNNPNKEIIREKMSKLHKNIPLSESHKEKIGKSNTGKNLGIKRTDAEKKHLSDLNSGEKNKFYGKHHKLESIEYCCHNIEQYNKDGYFLKEYRSKSIASKETGISRATIIRGCRDGKIRCGYIWKIKKH